MLNTFAIFKEENKILGKSATACPYILGWPAFPLPRYCLWSFLIYLMFNIVILSLRYFISLFLWIMFQVLGVTTM